ncbi:MAG: alpha-glucosidase/alpha-galactosidase [Candidatus Dormibacteraeota bacterium]|nr:alpha-glucosidase/alpha-galactosidase [Candidatus Dormibacteraeota bacterium]
MKVTFIGAGSLVFTRNLVRDLLLTPALERCTVALMDIDPERLRWSQAAVQRLVASGEGRLRVEATLDRREAVAGADYVITTFQQGGLDAYRLDIEVPRRHGVEQCVGDTLGPGGIFRGLRTIPVLLDLCRDLDELAPHALLLNYVNPMAINCWAVARATGRPLVGLCHSVQGTSRMLADWAGAPYEEVDFVCAGINHQAFFLTFRRRGEDLYPRIREAARRPEPMAREPVRIELMERFGYFVTESSGHASEYVPYFRKSSREVTEDLVPRFTDPSSAWFGNGRTGGYLATCEARTEELGAGTEDGAAPGSRRSHEYGSYILEAIETNQPIAVNGNVPNHGSIPNLPAGCCVEVPCLVSRAGIDPTVVGDLPPQLAALNRACVNVQELTVEAALTGNRDAVHQAALVDPLTAASASPATIHRMVEELLETQARWLPQFGGAPSSRPA